MSGSRYGTSIATMFGFVTDEDREQWAKQRAANEPKVSAASAALQAAGGALSDFTEQNIKSQLRAAHTVEAEKTFDESHVRTTSSGKQESVRYDSKDERVEIQPDFELN